MRSGNLLPTGNKSQRRVFMSEVCVDSGHQSGLIIRCRKSSHADEDGIFSLLGSHTNICDACSLTTFRKRMSDQVLRASKKFIPGIFSNHSQYIVSASEHLNESS
jgi:hypothetical protein